MITRFKSLKATWSLATTLLAWMIPLFAWAPLTSPGYFEFHSGFLPLLNLNDLMGQLADLGWAPMIGQPFDLLRGEGALAYRLAALPHLAGASPVASVKLIFAASLLAGSLGMYGWTRRRLGPWPALLAATVYVYGPILLATTYVRGAFAEAVVWGLMPWVLWAADSAADGRRWSTLGLTLGLAAALWTQSGLALWLAVIVLAEILWSTRRKVKPAGMALAGWAGGMALGALGLLPVALRHGWGGATYVKFTGHFVYPHQLLLAGWDAGPSIPGPDDTLTFSLGIMGVGLAVLSFFVARDPADPGSVGVSTHSIFVERNPQRFAILITLILAFLSTTLAAPFWRLLPFLSRTLTYPWQLLLLVGPWLAWLAGLGGRGLLAVWPDAERRRWAIPLSAGLLTLVLVASYGFLNPPTLDVPTLDRPVAIFGNNELALLTAELAGRSEPGEQVTLLTRWQALRPLDQDYTVFFHAIDQDGNRWGQQDTMPQDGNLPTSQWRPGQVVQDRYQLTLALDAPAAGEYRYLLGLYQWQTGERLSTGTDDKVTLTP